MKFSDLKAAWEKAKLFIRGQILNRGALDPILNAKTGALALAPARIRDVPVYAGTEEELIQKSLIQLVEALQEHLRELESPSMSMMKKMMSSSAREELILKFLNPALTIAAVDRELADPEKFIAPIREAILNMNRAAHMKPGKLMFKESDIAAHVGKSVPVFKKLSKEEKHQAQLKFARACTVASCAVLFTADKQQAIVGIYEGKNSTMQLVLDILAGILDTHKGNQRVLQMIAYMYDLSGAMVKLMKPVDGKLPVISPQVAEMLNDYLRSNWTESAVVERKQSERASTTTLLPESSAAHHELGTDVESFEVVLPQTFHDRTVEDIFVEYYAMVKEGYEKLGQSIQALPADTLYQLKHLVPEHGVDVPFKVRRNIQDELAEQMAAIQAALKGAQSESEHRMPGDGARRTSTATHLPASSKAGALYVPQRDRVEVHSKEGGTNIKLTSLPVRNRGASGAAKQQTLKHV